MKRFVSTIPLLTKMAFCFCVLLLVFATLHQLRRESEGYANSNLIPLEFISLALALLASAAQLFSVPYYLYVKRWRFAAGFLISAIIGLLCIVLAIIIDTETLLYAT